MKYSNVNIESGRIVYNGGGFKPSKNDVRKSAAEEAEAIIENAKKEAEKLIADGESKREAIFAAAEEQGYKSGIEKAYKDAERENEAALGEIKAIIGKLDAYKEKYIADRKRDIIELSFRIAEKVINQKLASDKEIFLKIYEKAVQDLVAQKWLKITVSKADADVATSSSDLLLTMVSGAERLEIKVLDDVPQGTCIVETTEKIIDASVRTQLNALREAVCKVQAASEDSFSDSI